MAGVAAVLAVLRFGGNGYGFGQAGDCAGNLRYEAAVRANDLAVGILEVAVLGAGGAGGEQEGGGEE